jgi:hypothetical protein
LESSRATAGVEQFEEQQKSTAGACKETFSKTEGRKSEGGNADHLNNFVVAKWLACWIGARLQRSGGKR